MVMAPEKGVVLGNLRHRDDGNLIDCTEVGLGGILIPIIMDRVIYLYGKAKFILILKNTIVMKLEEEKFHNTLPCIMMSGRGQPDVTSRLFLFKLR